MDVRDPSSLTIALLGRLANEADAAQIADAINAIWMEIESSLFPVLGQRGVTALYQRCLYITAREYPWLAGTFEGAQSSTNLPLLRATLIQRTPTNAAAASCALLQEFEELLAGLVGPSLTVRLLLSVSKNSLSGASAQETSS